VAERTLPTQLLRQAFSERPALDMAVSHSLLLRVAERVRPPAARVYEPGPTVAFSKLDSHAPGFATACDAARAHGYEPLIRLGGGHAAAYGPGCLVVEEIVTHDSVLQGLQERYARATATLESALRGLGAPVEAGALEGEYCAGTHSLHAGDVKVAGISQRVVKGAALTSAVVLVDAGPSIRAVLVDVYRALAIEWRPGTAGSLADVAPAPPLEDVARALSPEGAEPAHLDDEDLRRAAGLEPGHRA
jgi:octanoyl-[GcvH]:protein N-octanoyltransferase